MASSVAGIAVTVLLLCARSSFAAAPVDSNLLFAGMDLGSLLPVASEPTSELRSELVGVIVDGREVSMELVYREGEGFLLPAHLLGKLGIRGTSIDDRLMLQTPGGDVEAPRSYFRQLFGSLYFTDALLDDVLKISWEFSQEKYAFSMTLPWWQQERGPVDETLTAGDLHGGVDVSPSSFGLTQVRLDHTQYMNGDSNYGFTDLLLRGRLLDGVWRADVIAQENRPTRAEDYYWLRDFEQLQALVGNQDVLINPLLPALETTGAQGLYSSQGIDFNPYEDQTRSQYARRFGIPTKDIEGVSQPGAIAELRINERPIARARVNLDGTYRFRQIRSNSLQFQTVKVHILDQRSFIELDVQDFTRTPIDLLLDKRQTVAFGGVGVNGNPLDPQRGTDGEAVFGLVRHGLTERLTLEAGLQSASGEFHQTASLTASLARNWAATASIGHRSGAVAHSFDLYGRANRWQLTARSQQLDAEFRAPGSNETSSHEFRYEYWANRALSFGVHGRSRDTGTRTTDYLLPGFTWRFNNRNLVKVWPDFNGNYRVDVRTNHRQRDWFEFVHDSSGERVEYRYFRTQNHELFGRLNRLSFNETMLAELGTIWYPNRFDDRNQLGGSVLGGDNGFGFRFLWQTTVLPGLFSYMEVRDEPVATEFGDPGLQIRWTLSVDLSIAGGRPIPARNDFVQGRLGSVAGRLTLPDGESLVSLGVDKVSIMLDGRAHTAVLRGKNFFVRNVPPGIYDVELGSRFLPMTLSPRKISYRVKVVPAATSTVDFVVQQEFGLSGQVLDAEGVGIGSARVEIRDAEGVLIGSTYSDSYGYYRYAGLVPGSYQISLADQDGPEVSRKVQISDRYLFEADLQLAATDGR